MTTDRELLELAAKAFWAGDDVSTRFDESEGGLLYIHADNQDHNGQDREFLWNPLEDDGDALRLAVMLGICIEPDRRWNMTIASHPAFVETATEHYEDGMGGMGATCRAIVRVAAAIGEEMHDLLHAS